MTLLNGSNKKTEPKVLVNVLLTEKQINAFDSVWREKGYMSRSSYLRDLIMDSLNDSGNAGVCS